jgi:hypothetical protein
MPTVQVLSPAIMIRVFMHCRSSATVCLVLVCCGDTLFLTPFFVRLVSPCCCAGGALTGCPVR